MNVNSLLEGASPLQHQQSEAAKLAGKWEKSGLLEGLDAHESEKANMAVLLENQARQLVNEAQKVKVVDALDKATTAGEAKLVFETLQESFNFTGVEKRAIKEGLARASKPVGTAPKKVLSESVDETVSRFQKLANINK